MSVGSQHQKVDLAGGTYYYKYFLFLKPVIIKEDGITVL